MFGPRQNMVEAVFEGQGLHASSCISLYLRAQAAQREFGKPWKPKARRSAFGLRDSTVAVTSERNSLKRQQDK